jgi:hypothetical protein
VTHMFYRRALTAAFGRGEWVLRPVAPVQVEKRGDAICVAQTLALFVRGCFVWEAVGCGTYWATNLAMDKGDALETARSQALTRCCAKSSLGIATDPWIRRERETWLREHAVQVAVQEGQHRMLKWRRRDSEPFKGEIDQVWPREQASQPAPSPASPVAQQAAVPQAGAQPVPASAQAPEAQASQKQPHRGRPPKQPQQAAPSSARAVLQPVIPAAPQPTQPQPRGESPGLGDPQIRLFFAQARQRKLIVGDDASAAVKFLVERTRVDTTKLEGHTGAEICVKILREIKMSDYETKILTPLRQIGD